MSRWLLLLCALVLVAARLPSTTQMARMQRNMLKTASQLTHGEFDLQSKRFELEATCNLNTVFTSSAYAEWSNCVNPFDQTPTCTYLTTFTNWCRTEVAANNDHTCAESYQSFFKLLDKSGCTSVLLASCTTSADCVNPTQVCHYGFCEDTCTNTTTDCDLCKGETCGPSSTDNTRTTCLDPSILSTADNVAQRNAGLTGFKKQSFCTSDATVGVCMDYQRTINPTAFNCTDFEATGCCGPFFGRFYGDCFTDTDPTAVVIGGIIAMCNESSNANLLCSNEVLFPCTRNGVSQVGVSLMMIIATIIATFNLMF
jgi:hypothetical protein